jgi:pyruvate-formate lyase
VNQLSDGAPSDFNIREDFPLEKLVRVLRAFADGKGSNIMTVTVANPETLQQAEQDPDQYNLVRVRMGGWTEFFCVLFPPHKAHHRRRRIYTP